MAFEALNEGNTSVRLTCLGPVSTEAVTTALSIGWLLAELEMDLSSHSAQRLPDSSLTGASLHGSSASLLTSVPAETVRVRQIQAKFYLLKPGLARAGVPNGDLKAVIRELEDLAQAVASNEHDRSGAANGSDDAVTRRVQGVTQDVLANLTAASGRLGRGFGLGYDLANTCRLPQDAPMDELSFVFGERVVDVHEALADLASLLPEHASRAVTLSLAQWQYWAMSPNPTNRTLASPHAGVADALARQGQVWRTVLSGEKLGKDMLATDDYLGALKVLARRLVTGRPWVWLLLILFVAAATIGIYLLVAAKGELAKLSGAVLAGLGAVGIRTASLKRDFADVAEDIEAQVWGAELDFAVAEAITVPPGNWRVNLRKIDTPPPRGLDPHIASNSRTLHRVSRAVAARGPRPLRIWRVQQHLDDKFSFHRLNGTVETSTARTAFRRRADLARRLVEKRALGADPAEIKPGAPGRLISRHTVDTTHEEHWLVWTFHHGRLLDLAAFDDHEGATAEALRQKERSPAMPDPPPPPIRHGTDRRKLRLTEREVRRQLTPAAKEQALRLSSRTGRLALHAKRRANASPEVFIPRDPYLNLVQEALERRLEYVRLNRSRVKTLPTTGPQAADGTSLELGDQLFEQFGPDDFGWIKAAVEDVLTKLGDDKHSFGAKPAQYDLAQRARIVLLADWGTGTPRARKLGALARERLKEAGNVERHLIHLGDVYYCGLPDEYHSRFLDDWPALAGVVSWNLNGNHDMYSGGHGYFDTISHGPFAQQQGTSCFRLSNDHWQFIALDTAYADNDLYDAQLPWLEQWVGDQAPGSAGDPGPRTVLLSHHQLGSALAQRSVGAGIRDKTAKVRNTGRIHAWFWGHEHRCFVYERYLGVTCPVCLGNGGVPELLSPELTLASTFGWITGLWSEIAALFKRRVKPPQILYEPTTPDVDDDGLKWAKLGFVVLDLDGPVGTAVYVDEEGRQKAIESFAPPGQTRSPQFRLQRKQVPMSSHAAHLVDNIEQFFHKHRCGEGPAPIDVQGAAHAVEDLPPEHRDEGKRLLGLEAGTRFQRGEFDEVKDTLARDWGELEIVLPFLARFPKTNYAYDVTPTLRRGDRPDGDVLRDLARQGFTATLNLCKENPDGDRHLIKSEGLSDQLNAFHVGIVDGTPPSHAQMVDILRLLTALQANDGEAESLLAALEAEDKQRVNAQTANAMAGPRRVYIHCEAGKGRTGVGVACYRMAALGWDMADAVREAKNFGCSTPDQLEFIEDFGNALHDGHVDGYPNKPFGSVRATPEQLAATLDEYATPDSGPSEPQPAGAGV